MYNTPGATVAVNQGATPETGHPPQHRQPQEATTAINPAAPQDRVGELYQILSPHISAIRSASPNTGNIQDIQGRIQIFVDDYLVRAAITLNTADHQSLLAALFNTAWADGQNVTASPPPPEASPSAATTTAMTPPPPSAPPPAAATPPPAPSIPGTGPLPYPAPHPGMPSGATAAYSHPAATVMPQPGMPTGMPNGGAVMMPQPAPVAMPLVQMAPPQQPIAHTAPSTPLYEPEPDERNKEPRRSRIRQARVTSSRGNTRLSTVNLSELMEAKGKVQPLLIERIDVKAASKLGRSQIAKQIGGILREVLQEQKIQLNKVEQQELIEMLLDDMLGLGPLEPLLDDEQITDIMVNGPDQVYVERGGRLELTDVHFNDNQHVMNIASRIVTAVGRRVDETMPLADARLMDGSRVNIIIPPLAIDGPSISIRKFSAKKITLEMMAQQGNISPAMETVLRIAGRSRLNILIAGGTGSGKTTLLNAISQMIDEGERIVSIEDAAELQLQQPHVVRLETRPPNLEGDNEITMRDLLKNSLRMRPDRIILGEVRGEEAVDMLQAMNTGHDGSLGTIHANRPREALSRLENMIGLSNVNLPARAVRTQISSALDMIVQVSRMRDGKRRITSIMEIVGMEGEVITTQELFTFKFKGEDKDGNLLGDYVCSGLRPHFAAKAAYFGLENELMRVVASSEQIWYIRQHRGPS